MVHTAVQFLQIEAGGEARPDPLTNHLAEEYGLTNLIIESLLDLGDGQ
jgi:hypothetical protein